MIGKIAVLRSGGPQMTIMWRTMTNKTAAANVSYYTCGWFNEGEFNEAEIPPSCLRILKDQPNKPDTGGE